MNKLYRSRRDRKLFGLCGGLAEALNVDATLLRLVIVITAVFSGGAVIAIYVIACLVIPKEPGYDAPPAFHGPQGWQPPQWQPSQWQPNMHRHSPPVQPTPPPAAPSPASSGSQVDDMMRDIEKKALHKELEALRAKLAQYEAGAAKDGTNGGSKDGNEQ